MTANEDQKKVEEYTRDLIDVAKDEGGAKDQDLVRWQHAQSFSPEVIQTLTTMSRQDVGNLVENAMQYKELLDREHETVTVTVTTCVPLDDHLRETVAQKASRELGAPVYLVERVDPKILGGIILEVEERRYDASARAKLAYIRKTLSSTFIGSDDNE